MKFAAIFPFLLLLNLCISMGQEAVDTWSTEVTEIEHKIDRFDLKEALSQIEIKLSGGDLNQIQHHQLLLLKGRIYSYLDYPVQAASFKDKASDFFKKEQGEDSFLHLLSELEKYSFGLLGINQIAYQNYKEFHFLLEKFERLYPNRHQELSRIYVNYFRMVSKYNENEKAFALSKISHSKIDPLHLLLYKVCYADLMRVKGYIDLSFTTSKEVMGELEKHGMSNTVLSGYLLRNMGLAHEFKGNLELAQIYLERSYEERKVAVIFPSKSPYINNSYSNLGGLAMSSKDYQSALNYYTLTQESRKEYAAFEGKKYDPNSDHLMSFNYGNLQYKMENYDRALEHFTAAIDELSLSLTDQDLDEEYYYRRIGLYTLGPGRNHLRLGEYQKVIELLDPIVDYYVEHEIVDFSEITSVFLVHAQALFHLGEYELCHRSLAYSVQANKYTPGDFSTIISYVELVEYFLLRTKTLIIQNDDAAIFKIQEEYKSTLSHLVNNFSIVQKNPDLISFSFEWFDLLLDYYIGFLDQSNSEKYKRKILELIQWKEGIVFINDQEKNRRSNLDGDILDETQLIKDQIRHLEKERFIAIENYKDSSKLKDEISELKIKFDLLDKKHTDHSQTANFDLIEVDQFQANLEERELFLQYFSVHDSLFCLRMNQNDIQIFPLADFASINRQVLGFYNSIFAYHVECKEARVSLEEQTKIFYTLGNSLYQVLIKDLGTEDYEQLIISPSQTLSFLPFEALPKNDGVSGQVLDVSQLLLQDHIISYLPFIGLAHGRMEEQKYAHELSLFAPEFKEMDSVFCNADEYRNKYVGPIKFAQQEVNNISKAFKSELFTQENANLKNFDHICGDSKLLHLATHSKIDFNNDKFSYILFAGDDDETMQKLFFNDLYKYSIPAKCVVLSACESGLGKYYQGEGVRSLARGFLSAGAHSVVASLWSVNDRSTSMLMDEFYKNLQSGYDKHDALRQAKLNYISSVDLEYQHPFYWAGFVAIGDMEAIQSQSNIASIFIAIVLIVLLLLSVLWYQFNLKRK